MIPIENFRWDSHASGGLQRGSSSCNAEAVIFKYLQDSIYNTFWTKPVTKKKNLLSMLPQILCEPSGLATSKLSLGISDNYKKKEVGKFFLGMPIFLM